MEFSLQRKQKLLCYLSFSVYSSFLSDKRSPFLFQGFDGGDLAQSKKERIRKLSAIGRGATSTLHEGCQMGCVVSDGEDELPSKRLKLPTKVLVHHTSSSCFLIIPLLFLTTKTKFPLQFLDACNGAHHASVPRKLRSGMCVLTFQMGIFWFCIFVHEFNASILLFLVHLFSFD